MNTEKRYRIDIQVLRGLAVLAVVTVQRIDHHLLDFFSVFKSVEVQHAHDVALILSGAAGRESVEWQR